VGDEMTEKEIEQKLIEYDNLIHTIASRYHLEGMSHDDIAQEVSMQFVKALKDFDKSRGNKFETVFYTYVMNWFRKAIYTQTRAKRGKMVLTFDRIAVEGENAKDQDKFQIDNLESHYITPLQVEQYDSLIKAIYEFCDTQKGGYIIIDRLLNERGYDEIAKERGTTQQNEASKFVRMMNKLKNYLKENEYI